MLCRLPVTFQLTICNSPKPNYSPNLNPYPNPKLNPYPNRSPNLNPYPNPYYKPTLTVTLASSCLSTDVFFNSMNIFRACTDGQFGQSKKSVIIVSSQKYIFFYTVWT